MYVSPSYVHWRKSPGHPHESFKGKCGYDDGWTNLTLHNTQIGVFSKVPQANRFTCDRQCVITVSEKCMLGKRSHS